MSSTHAHLPWKVFQAPVGSCCTPELVTTVSNAGGLGAFAFTWKSCAEIRQLIRQTKQLTSNTFQANFVLQFPVEEQLNEAIKENIPLVTFSWGIPPMRFVEKLRDHHIPFGIQVVEPSQLPQVLEISPNFIILQGVEAGGHVQSKTPLLELFRSISSSVKSIPIVVAGGVSSPKEAQKYAQMGADGIVLGTQFVSSIESGAHPTYKQMITKAKQQDLVLTKCFEIGWENASHRIIRNSTYKKWEDAGFPSLGSRPDERISPTTNIHGIAEQRYSDNPPLITHVGNIEEMCLYAGMGVEHITRVRSASDIVKEFHNAMCSA